MPQSISIRWSLSATTRIWLLVLLSLVGYLGLAIWFPLRPHYKDSPSPDISTLAPSLLSAVKYALLICALYLIYIYLFRAVRNHSGGLPLKTILLLTALFILPLVFTFPINAIDIYNYFILGRITALHGLDPFSVSPAQIPYDPFVTLSGEWINSTSPYGPLWEIVSAGVAKIAVDNLLLALLLFKAIGALTHCAVAVLIWKLVGRMEPQRRASAAVLWAWNPALLLIFTMNGHNDGLMIFILCLGWLLVNRGRLFMGSLILLMAPLVKPISLLALPFLLLSVWRKILDPRAKTLYLLAVISSAFVLSILAFLPFGNPVGMIDRLRVEASTGGGFSPIAMLVLRAESLGFDIPTLAILRISSFLFIIVGILLFYLAWKGRSPLRSAADIFFGYFIYAFRFRAWYPVWPFPWLILDSSEQRSAKSSARAHLAAGMTLLLTAQLSVVIYGQMRILIWDGSHLKAHLYGVPFTFVLPLVVGLAVYAYNEHLSGPRRGRSGRSHKPMLTRR